MLVSEAAGNLGKLLFFQLVELTWILGEGAKTWSLKRRRKIGEKIRLIWLRLGCGLTPLQKAWNMWMFFTPYFFNWKPVWSDSNYPSQFCLMNILMYKKEDPGHRPESESCKLVLQQVITRVCCCHQSPMTVSLWRRISLDTLLYSTKPSEDEIW